MLLFENNMEKDYTIDLFMESLRMYNLVFV